MTTGLTILMPTDDFPKTAQYLFVGGPKHGQRLEVIEGDPTHRVIAPPAPANLTDYRPVETPESPAAGAFEVHTYVRQRLGLQDSATGERFTQFIFIHDRIPNPEMAKQLVFDALLAEFVRTGRKVDE